MLEPNHPLDALRRDPVGEERAELDLPEEPEAAVPPDAPSSACSR